MHGLLSCSVVLYRLLRERNASYFFVLCQLGILEHLRVLGATDDFSRRWWSSTSSGWTQSGLENLVGQNVDAEDWVGNHVRGVRMMTQDLVVRLDEPNAISLTTTQGYPSSVESPANVHHCLQKRRLPNSTALRQLSLPDNFGDKNSQHTTLYISRRSCKLDI